MLPACKLKLCAALLGATTLFAAPAVAADAGGAGGYAYGDPPAGVAAASTSVGTIQHRSSALLGRTLTVRGVLAGGRVGDTVRVERQDVLGAWAPAASVTAGDDGSYVARWRTDLLGTVALRAVGERAAASAASAAPVTRLTVFKPAKATWYGPGFWGRTTACGQKLRRATLGVANKRLPCGSLVQLYANGRTITVPVIDRGPFKKGTSYDLTQATAKALRFTGTGRIGVLRGAPAS